MDINTLNSMWVLACVVLVFAMQAGFLCLESGLTRSRNSINVAIKNMTDLSVSVLLFWAFGFSVMFGASQGGLIGIAPFFPDFESDSLQTVSFFLFQAMFCATAATILSGAVAERMRFSAYLTATLIVSGIIYPVIGHWVWGCLGNESLQCGWLAAMGFVDFAGAAVVHGVGGSCALAAALVIGPRAGRFASGRQEIPGSNIPMAMLGTLLMWFGWLGFNGGSNLAVDDSVGRILVNTLMGGAAGMTASLVAGWVIFKRPEVSLAINGSLSGLVAVTACCHAVSVQHAVAIGSIGGVVMLTLKSVLERLEIDDAIDAIPVHAGAGIWSTVAVALFGQPDLLGTGLSFVAQLFVQAVGAAVIVSTAFIVTYVLLRAIHRHYSLRVSAEEEHAGLNVAEHGATTEVFELLSEMETHRRQGDFSTKATVEPFTEVGQIAVQYNSVLDRVNEQEQKLRDAHEEAERLLAAIDSVVVGLDQNGLVTRWNAQAETMFGIANDEAVGKTFTALPIGWEDPKAARELSGDRAVRYETTLHSESEINRIVVLVTCPLLEDCRHLGTLILGTDLTEERLLEQQLRQAQKLESVGQLAAGVAHEINTPMQYIGDNLMFLDRKTQLLEPLMDVLFRLNGESRDEDELIDNIEECLTRLKSPRFIRQVQDAIADSREGVQHVSSIVSAMKQFSHPGQEERAAVDINAALQSTVTVSTGEWKYVAEIETDFDTSLPAVPVFAVEMNQVFLNILVNAAHAIAEAGEDSTNRGKIIIATRRRGEDVEISIADSGTGIPDDIKDRIFDPFFTTKEVGRGTGQGLAIAYSVVVQKHGGTLLCDSIPGKGTTFRIRLPIEVADDCETAAEPETACPATA